MAVERQVKDVMALVEEYQTVDADAPLCDVLGMLRKDYEKIQAKVPGRYHKTVLVTDALMQIIGKVSPYDLIRGLVPEVAKKPESSKSYYRALSVRFDEVANEVSAVQERFKWLNNTFMDLVKQETQKKVRDVMSPIHPLLHEQDSLNLAVYVMFKEDVRQPAVVRDGRVVGIVNLIDIISELLEIAGDQCFWTT
jgi:CBS-domain-containing membrane protein